MKIGVLALQGAVDEHLRILESLNVEGTKVRKAEDLVGLDGLIIPGGESTTIGKLADRFALTDAIRQAVKDGMGVYGTCAGMILSGADTVLADGTKSDQTTFSLIDIDTRRNAFGSQIESCEAMLDIKGLDEPLNAVFIRAPVIERIGDGVEVLATFRDKPVVARKDNILVSSFHPELTDDSRLHELFIKSLDYH